MEKTREEALEIRRKLKDQLAGIMESFDAIGGILNPLMAEDWSQVIQRNISPNGLQFVYRARPGETCAVYEHNGT